MSYFTTYISPVHCFAVTESILHIDGVLHGSNTVEYNAKPWHSGLLRWSSLPSNYIVAYVYCIAFSYIIIIKSVICSSAVLSRAEDLAYKLITEKPLFFACHFSQILRHWQTLKIAGANMLFLVYYLVQ